MNSRELMTQITVFWETYPKQYRERRQKHEIYMCTHVYVCVCTYVIRQLERNQYDLRGVTEGRNKMSRRKIFKEISRKFPELKKVTRPQIQRIFQVSTPSK